MALDYNYPFSSGAVHPGTYSLLDSHFGIAGDGSDEGNAIQAAMNEIGALKGALFIPPTVSGFGHSAPLIAPGDLTILGLGPYSRFVALSGFPSTYSFKSVTISAPQLIWDRSTQTMYTASIRDLYFEGNNIAPVGLLWYLGASGELTSCAARNHTDTNIVMCAAQNSSVRNVRTANATNYNFRYVNCSRNCRVNIHCRKPGVSNVLIDNDAADYPNPFPGLPNDLTTFEGGVWEDANTSKKSALWIKNAQNLIFEAISPTASAVTLTEALLRIDGGSNIHFVGPLRGDLGASRVPILINKATGVRFGSVFIANIGSSGNLVPRLFVSTQPIQFDDTAPTLSGFYSKLGFHSKEALASVPSGATTWQNLLFGSVTAAAVTWVSATVLRRVGVDETARWTVGRRVQAVGTATGTITGVVASSTLNGSDTDITILWDLAASPTNESLTLAGLSDLAASSVYEANVWQTAAPATGGRVRVRTLSGATPTPSIPTGEAIVAANIAFQVSGNDVQFSQATGGTVNMTGETRKLA